MGRPHEQGAEGVNDFELDANLNGSTLETAGAKARRATEQPPCHPWECSCKAVGVNCGHPDPRADHVDQKAELTAALKVLAWWQNYRAYLQESNAVTGLTEQALLFYATLDIHA